MADSRLRRDIDINDDNTIEIKKWETSFFGENISLWVILYKENFYFFANEVTTNLGFKDSRSAIRNNTDPEDTITIENLLGKNFKTILKRHFQGRAELARPLFFRNLQPHQTLLNEFAVYALCLGSKLDRVKPFRRWVYETIKTIRLTGSYTLPNGPFDNPLEMMQQISLQIPPYNKSGKNLERKAICKALREAYNSAKNPPNVRAGKKGGLKTQEDIRDLKDSFYKLKSKVDKSIEKFETELKIILEDTSSSSERRSSSESE